MDLLKGLIGATIGGAIGAAVWAGITYGTGYEIGWIAWGIGGVVGLGSAMMNRSGGAAAGLIAAVVSVVAICAGKYTALEMAIGKFSDSGSEFLVHDLREEYQDPEVMTAYIADLIIGEKMDNGEAIAWPAGVDGEMAMVEADYPAEIWSDAAARWDAMSPAEQDAYREATVESMAANIAAFAEAFESEFARQGFFSSFGPMDILFFGLAVVTAFKIASTVTVGGAEV